MFWQLGWTLLPDDAPCCFQNAQSLQQLVVKKVAQIWWLQHNRDQHQQDLRVSLSGCLCCVLEFYYFRLLVLVGFSCCANLFQLAVSDLGARTHKLGLCKFDINPLTVDERTFPYVSPKG